MQSSSSYESAPPAKRPRTAPIPQPSVNYNAKLVIMPPNSYAQLIFLITLNLAAASPQSCPLLRCIVRLYQFGHISNRTVNVNLYMHPPHSYPAVPHAPTRSPPQLYNEVTFQQQQNPFYRVLKQVSVLSFGPKGRTATDRSQQVRHGTTPLPSYLLYAPSVHAS
jgi:hypothetical protein